MKSFAFNIFRFLKLSYLFVIVHGRYIIYNSGFDRYLFQVTALLKSYFNCVNNFASSSVDKVTTRTTRFVPVIVNVGI